jgi:hypothetical protein
MCHSLKARSFFLLPVVACTMFENQQDKDMSNGKKNMITKELITDVLMVALLATAIVLLALVL